MNPSPGEATSKRASELVEALRKVLDDERQAIRRLDTDAVLRAAEEKELLVAEMSKTPPAERSELAEGIKALRGELRRNLVLLAHARDCVREAIETCGRRAGSLNAEL